MPSPEPMDVDIAARADLEAQVPRASCLRTVPKGFQISVDFRLAAMYA